MELLNGGIAQDSRTSNVSTKFSIQLQYPALIVYNAGTLDVSAGYLQVG